MTVAEFEAVRCLLNISDDRVNAAHAALVEGRTFQSIADQYNWTRQAVNDAVGVVWRTLDNYREAQRAELAAMNFLPPGWEQTTFVAPSPLIAKFRDEIKRYSVANTMNNSDG